MNSAGNEATLSPHPPVTSAYAWTLALLPLISIALGFALDHAGLSDRIASYASLGLTVGLVTADRQILRQANYTNAPAQWWFVLIPVYLWKRANILQESQRKFWVQIASFVAVFSIVIGIAALTDSPLAIPSCSASKEDAIRIFDGIGPVKQANLTATALTDITETSLANNIRHCKGIITTNTGSKYALNFDIYRQNEKIYIQDKIGAAQ
jgi:hypothetical protein